MNYFVYILECADGSFYTGCTNNLGKRIKQHNESKEGAHYTKIRRPVALIHTELYLAVKEARGREAEIKRMNRDEKLNLIKNSPSS